MRVSFISLVEKDGVGMVQVIPWLLEREYRQHRSLDQRDLPDRYSEWLTKLTRVVAELAETGRRVVKMVVHPGELELWAQQSSLSVNDATRRMFAASRYLFGYVLGAPTGDVE